MKRYPFKGEFKELKSKGYNFWKAYADNYKVYTKKLDHHKKINIWVAHGGHIEYSDLGCFSYEFFEALKRLKDSDYRVSSMGSYEYVYLIFDWYNVNSKPEIHQWGLSHRTAMLAMEGHEAGYSEQTMEERYEAFEKAKKEIYAGRDLHEITLTKCSVTEILNELNNIKS